MKNHTHLFTSESVSEGHPDKIADQISDAVLDDIISRDPKAKVACESFVSNGFVLVGGEITTKTYSPIVEIARNVLKDIGYTNPAFGLDYRGCAVLNAIGQQSPDIAMGVELDDGEIGAGDQGVMFGYSSNETEELMPIPITIAHKLMMKQSELRNNGKLEWLRPDAKSQVSIRYEKGKPKSIEKIVISTQHAQDIEIDRISEDVINEIIEPVLPENLDRENIQYHINPTGRFEIGGPAGDTGLTGRKIIIDTYGGSAPHGGGCFSGKDPTKVDRSGSYMARYIAKNIVAAGLAERCTIQLSYAIGVVDPTSLMVNLHGTGEVDEQELEKAIPEIFKLSPRGIIESLDLRRPIYLKTASYGHFGRELPEFTWERTDKIEDLKRI